METIYGPVTSLRYGTTIGVNLLGAGKVCSYDCPYCDLGPSTLTMNKIRKEHCFPSLEDLQKAFENYLSRPVTCDHIVVSGNGEPTLHPQFDDAMGLLIELRNRHLAQVPLVVLSNGAHLDGRRAVMGMNVVDQRVIKVDAGSDALMGKVNAPLVRINLSKLLAGVQQLRDCVIQAMFVTGTVDNTAEADIEEWIEVVGMIKPKLVQLGTLTRPAHVAGLRAVEEDRLDSIAFKLKKRTSLEVSVFVQAKR